MIVLQVILWIIFALILLVGLTLCLKITVRLKYGEQKAVILGIGIFRINLTKLRERRENRKKKRPKIQRLSKTLPSANKDVGVSKKNTALYKSVPERTDNASVASSAKTGEEKKTDSDSAESKKTTEKKSAIEQAKNAHEPKKQSISQMLKAFINGKSLTENLTLLKNILTETSALFSKHAHIRIRKLSVIVSCPDAADTAVLFGMANGVVASVMGIVEDFRVFDTKNASVGVYQDYISGKSKLLTDISFSMRVFQVLWCLAPTLKAVLNNKTKSSPKEKNS